MSSKVFPVDANTTRVTVQVFSGSTGQNIDGKGDDRSDITQQHKGPADNFPPPQIPTSSRRKGKLLARITSRYTLEEDVSTAQIVKSVVIQGLRSFFCPPSNDKIQLEGRALLCLGPHNRFRRAVARIMAVQAVDIFILACICLNIIILILQDFMLELHATYEKDPSALHKALILKIANYVVTGVFVAEMLLKWVTQQAFVGKGAYIRDHWNKLDFVIVLFALLEVLLDALAGIMELYGTTLGVSIPTKPISAFRAFRALRPLRSVRFFSGIRAILESLTQSLRLVIDVLLFLGFFIVFFGVMGVELFGNSLNRRCVFDAQNGTETMNPLIFCKTDEKCRRHFCFNGDLTTYNLNSSDYNCSLAGAATFDLHGSEDWRPRGVACNADFGNPTPITNFDNFGFASLTIFQISTLDGWAPTILHPLMDSEFFFGFAYFLAIIFFLTYLVVNLFVAVVTTTFANVRESHKSGFSGEV